MHQFTLRAIRISNGYSTEEVANHCGVSVREIEESEIDSSEIEYSLLKNLIDLYGVTLDIIYLGSECRGNERVTQYF